MYRNLMYFMTTISSHCTFIKLVTHHSDISELFVKLQPLLDGVRKPITNLE